MSSSRFFARALALLLISSSAHFAQSEALFPQVKIFPVKKLEPSLRRSLRSLKLACLWTSRTKVKTVLKISQKTRVLARNDLKGRIPSNRQSTTLRTLDKICKAYTSPGTEHPTATPTSTPTPQFTPTNAPTALPTFPIECSGTTGSCPKIYSINPEAGPGDVINIAGGSFSSATRVYLQTLNASGQSSGESPIELENVNVNPALLQVRLPSITRDVWAIWISQSGMNSRTVFVNEPKIQQLSETTIASGDELTVWGRALSGSVHGPFHSSASFHTSNEDIPAAITFEDQYKLKITVPSGIVSGNTYTLRIDNGFGGYGESVSLKGQTARPDPLGLNVWWAHEIPSTVYSKIINVKTDQTLAQRAFGDGIHDDTSAIQESLNKVGLAGGGTVYLPNGTYKISQSLLVVKPYVILQGESMLGTVIEYGENAVDGRAAFYFAENNVTHAGISTLTLNNKNRTGIVNGSIRHYSKVGLEKLFVDRVRYFGGPDGESIAFNDIPYLLISNNELHVSLRYTTTGRLISPLSVTQSTDVVIRDNSVTYDVGRVQLDRNDGALILSNHFTRNGDPAVLQTRIDNSIETGGTEFSFTKNIIFDGNTIDATQPIPEDGFNDGENCMCQGSIYTWYKWGEISQVTPLSIQVPGKLWSESDFVPPVPEKEVVIAIVRGPGAGQIRTFDHVSGSIIFVKEPWDIIPVPGESSWIATQRITDSTMFLDNYLHYGRRGILIYNGGENISAFRNTLEDTSGIEMMGDDLNPNNGDPNNYYRYLLWHVSIRENIVKSVAGLIPSFIKVQTEFFVPELLHGITTYDVDVTDNDIIASSPAAPARGLHDEDGALYVTVGGAGHECTEKFHYSDTPYGTLGAVVSSNRSQNDLAADRWLKIGKCTQGTSAASNISSPAS